MANSLLPEDAEQVESFKAILDEAESQVEMWESKTPVPRILRWSVPDRAALFSWAVADTVVVSADTPEEIETAVQRLIDKKHIQPPDQTEGDVAVLTVRHPLSFWKEFAALREGLALSADLEPQTFLRLNPLIRRDQGEMLPGDELDWIGVPQVWKMNVEDPDARVAVIDTGVDPEHPSLKSRLARDADGALIGLNLLSQGEPPLDDADDSHGTYCAGLIAGEPDGKFRGGVLHKGGLIPVKAFNSSGWGTNCQAARGIEFAVQKGAWVISASWSSLSRSPLLRRRIAQAGRHGCLFVTAAGNEEIDLDLVRQYPASYQLPNILVVGGVSDTLNPVCDWGRGSRSVHLSAPGETVLSAQRTIFPYNLYQSPSGTSAATALAAGAAAAVQGAALQANGQRMCAVELKRALIASATPKGQLNGFSCSGGLLNLHNAVKMVFGEYQPAGRVGCG